MTQEGWQYFQKPVVIHSGPYIVIYLYTRFTETRRTHPLLFGVVPFLAGTHRKLPYIRDHLWQPYLLCKRSSPSRRTACLVKGRPIFKRSAKLKTEWMRERGRCQISNAGHAHCTLGCWAGGRGQRNLYLEMIGKKISTTQCTSRRNGGGCSFRLFRCDKMAAVET